MRPQQQASSTGTRLPYTTVFRSVRGAAKQAVRHRIAGQDGPRKRERARCLAYYDRQAFAKRCHLVARERGVGFIVGERCDMHRRELRQRLEHMPAAAAVAAVGGPWRAVKDRKSTRLNSSH